MTSGAESTVAGAVTMSESAAARLREVIAERDRYREALEYLADAESWAGDPRYHDTTLYGHDTPYELARRALGR